MSIMDRVLSWNRERTWLLALAYSHIQGGKYSDKASAVINPTYPETKTHNEKLKCLDCTHV